MRNSTSGLPASLSFLEIEPPSIVLSAVKKAEKEDALVIRIYNTGKTAQNAALKLYRPVRSASLINLKEDEIAEQIPLSVDGNKLTLKQIPPRKIVTLKLQL
ncbi:MAG: glycosyl hydrolase-related protein [Candidatus Freyarchaeota archaeon]